MGKAQGDRHSQKLKKGLATLGPFVFGNCPPPHPILGGFILPIYYFPSSSHPFSFGYGPRNLANLFAKEESRR